MIHIRDNIKIIRSLWKMSQPEFAALFSHVNLNKQKYIEQKAENIDVLYLSELSKMTGVSEKELLSKKIDPAKLPDKPIKDEKDENVKRETLENKQKQTNGNSQSLLNLTESNKTLSLGIVKHIDNESRLIALLEAEKKSTAGVNQENFEDIVLRVKAMEEMIVEIVADGDIKKVEGLKDVLNKKVMALKIAGDSTGTPS